MRPSGRVHLEQFPPRLSSLGIELVENVIRETLVCFYFSAVYTLPVI